MQLDLYGWFPEENKETLSRLINEHNIKTVIEIGCFLGKSTAWFVEQGCTVTTIDTFEGAQDLNGSAEVIKRLPTLFEQFCFNMKALGIEDKVRVIRMRSDEAVYLHNIRKADLVYIDGSHVYEDVIKDIIYWGIFARKVLCGDDYTPHQPGVRKAVDKLLPDADKKQRVWFEIKR